MKIALLEVLMRKGIVIIMMLLLSACDGFYSLLEEQSDTLVLPDFISYIFVANLEDTTDICLAVNQGAAWTIGDDAESLYHQIIRSLRLELNEVDITDTLDIVVFDTLNEVFSENRELLGTYGGEITVCFNVDNLPIQTHFVYLEFLNTQETSFSFSWSFEIGLDNNLPEIILPHMEHSTH